MGGPGLFLGLAPGGKGSFSVATLLGDTFKAATVDNLAKALEWLRINIRP